MKAQANVLGDEGHPVRTVLQKAAAATLVMAKRIRMLFSDYISCTAMCVDTNTHNPISACAWIVVLLMR